MNKEFLAELELLLDTSVPEPIEYRLHYDQSGKIYSCTTQDHPTDTQYVVVDKGQYDRYYDYYVIDGHLKKFDRDFKNRVNLTKSDRGYKTVKGHAGIILENEDYPEIEYYERRNH